MTPRRRTNNPPFVSSLILAIASLTTAHLHAADGQVDLLLNPAATTTISSSGSYILVSDVTMNSNITAISVTADNVTIDLNGHVITGDGNSATTAVGITTSGSFLTVRNGTIESFRQGFTNSSSPTHTTLEGVTFRGNFLRAALTSANSAVRRCLFEGNTLSQTSGSVLENGTDGILTVEDCSFLGNGSGTATLIVLSVPTGGGIIRRNLFRNTGVSGVSSFTAINVGSITADLIEDNSIISCFSGGSVTGIFSGSGARILGNTISDNSGTSGFTGIVANSRAHVEGNFIMNNQASTNAATAISGIGEAVIRNNTVMSLTGNSGVSGITYNGVSSISQRYIIEGNLLSALTTTSGSALGISLINGLPTTATVNDNTIAGLSSNSGTATGINITEAGTVTGNVVEVVSSVSSTAIAVEVGNFSVVRDNNLYGGQSSTAAVLGACVRVVGNQCSVENNTCGFRTNTAGLETGIVITGDDASIVGNRILNANDNAISFAVGADNGYHAANIMEDVGVSDLGLSNDAGTMPGANVTY